MKRTIIWIVSLVGVVGISKLLLGSRRGLSVLSRLASELLEHPHISLLLRAGQMFVAAGINQKSLRRRLFKFTGRRRRPALGILKEILKLRSQT